MKSILAALILALAATPALAQDADAAPDLVDALVVNARTPGPAWWSVSKGDAKVWVLGTGVAVPADMGWDAAAFDKRIKATRRVILPELSGKTHFSKETLAADRPWVDELTPAERARLAEIEAKAKRPAGFYAHFRPNMAGMLIKTDLADPTLQKRTLALDDRARRLRARLTPVKGKVVQAMRASFGKGQHDGLACVRWALSPELQQKSDRARAEAWARGDVRLLVTGPMAYDPCVQSLNAMRDSFEVHETAVADEIARTLDKGESAVAFVGLTPLLRQGGVLDQLRQRGYVVRTPAQLDED